MCHDKKRFLAVMLGIFLALCGAVLLPTEGPIEWPYGIAEWLLIIGLGLTAYNMVRLYRFDLGFELLVKFVHRNMFDG